MAEAMKPHTARASPVHSSLAVTQSPASQCSRLSRLDRRLFRGRCKEGRSGPERTDSAEADARRRSQVRPAYTAEHGDEYAARCASSTATEKAVGLLLDIAEL